MSAPLPNSIRRRTAGLAQQRESALLDSFEKVRDVQTAILGEPDADTYLVAAEEMGLRPSYLALQAPVVGLYDGDKLVAVVIDRSAENEPPMILPVE